MSKRYRNVKSPCFFYQISSLIFFCPVWNLQTHLRRTQFTHKAKHLTKGFTQKKSVDYEETFSPVVRFSFVRMILSIVTHMNLELHQMDVNTAFLNGDLEEEIYMKQPIGYVEKGHEDKVCKLHKSIYGLKQSLRQWYKKFHNTIMSNGFSMCYEDYCIYIKQSQHKFVLLSLYVNDILLACNDIGFLIEIKDWLSSVFEMKDLGEAEFIFGVKITRIIQNAFLAYPKQLTLRKF